MHMISASARCEACGLLPPPLTQAEKMNAEEPPGCVLNSTQFGPSHRKRRAWTWGLAAHGLLGRRSQRGADGKGGVRMREGAVGSNRTPSKQQQQEVASFNEESKQRKETIG